MFKRLFVYTAMAAFQKKIKKINCLFTVKHELLLVGSMTILHFSRRVAKGTLKLLLDR
jgi:hypothetical protein